MSCLTVSNQSIQSVISACTTSIQVLQEWRIIDSGRAVTKSTSCDDGSVFFIWTAAINCICSHEGFYPFQTLITLSKYLSFHLSICLSPLSEHCTTLDWKDRNQIETCQRCQT